MKKLILSVPAILMAITMSANPVGLQKAREIAGQHFGTPVSSAKFVSGSRISLPATRITGTPAYYVFNNDGGGFVIVAGDDCLTPILATSPSGRFDESHIPPALSIWLDEVSNTIKAIRTLNLPQLPRTQSEWENVSVNKAPEAGGKLLELPTWDQIHPYNWFCPIISSLETERSITGCVATAISMVMRYHQWPPCGHGTLPGYTYQFALYTIDADGYPNYTGKYRGVSVDGHSLGHEYKWSMMPMGDIYNDDESSASDSDKQVAWLMWDCGVMMQASYSAMGTGAYSDDIPERLAQYMYYTEADYVKKSSYSASNWLSLIKAQIDEGLPVIYGADCDDGGHQFVVHGYDSADRLYVNWGWGGYCNSYFALDNFSPYSILDLSYLLDEGWTQQDIDEVIEANEFNSNHDAIINLRPDKSVTPVPTAEDYPVRDEVPDEPDPDLYLKAGKYNNKYDYTGISVVSGTLARSQTFYLQAGLLCNDGASKYTGYYRFDQFDWQGNLVGTLGTRSGSGYVNPGKTWTVYNVQCSGRFDFNLGDMICLTTSEQENGTYKKIPRKSNDTVTVDELYLVPMYFIAPSGENKLTNSNESYQAVSWSSDENSVRAVISYSDGSTETIIKE